MPRLLIGNIKGTKGDTGAQGERGLAGTVEIGSVQTVGYGSPASVTNSGTEEEAILDFQIPQGAPGAQVTDMSTLVLGAITDSTASYPAFAVNETGSTIFGKIRKFLSDLYNNTIKSGQVTTSTNVDEAGYVADARSIKSLNDSLANFQTEVASDYATKTDLTNGYVPQTDSLTFEGWLAAFPCRTDGTNIDVTIPCSSLKNGTLSVNGNTTWNIFVGSGETGYPNKYITGFTIVVSSVIRVTRDVLIVRGAKPSEITSSSGYGVAVNRGQFTISST